MNRRDLLRATFAAGAASVLPASLRAGESSAVARRLRVAHLTDVHVIGSEAARGGFARALAKAYAEKPDLILVGGDCVMDASATATAEARRQWGEWQAIRKDFNKIPIHAVLGNHDYHWSSSRPSDPLARRIEGAKWALDELQMKERFSSFDAGGWRFVLLDSTAWPDGGYRAELDGPQMDFLRAELAREPKKPLLVSSHISIFSACAYNDPSTNKDAAYSVPKSWMHADALKIKEAFDARGNVRLCLSGHMHQRDDITLNDTRYICAGAVSGNWWKGRYFDTDPGFLVADLFPDGRAETRYVLYDEPKSA